MKMVEEFAKKNVGKIAKHYSVTDFYCMVIGYSYSYILVMATEFNPKYEGNSLESKDDHYVIDQTLLLPGNRYFSWALNWCVMDNDKNTAPITDEERAELIRILEL